MASNFDYLAITSHMIFFNLQGSLQEVRPLPRNAVRFHRDFKRCHNDDPCPRSTYCTYAHSNLELQAWNKRKGEILNRKL